MFDRLKDKTALYIEDEIEVLEQISKVFENYFERIYVVDNAEGGYEILLKYKVDILLVDIELPKMNGIELIGKIREKNKNIQIIVVSAYTKTNYFLECINYKVDAYIIKPFTFLKIQELLKKLNHEFKTDEITSTILYFDDNFSFNSTSSQLLYNNTMIHLTKKERTLLIFFLEHKNHLISIANIEYQLWPDKESNPSRRRSLISRLRTKLKQNFIETYPSEGYIFRIKY
ncbi:MAG TPA: response regulator [Lutibacter sp.]|nr:response regulator [Lutibacter sp.]